MASIPDNSWFETHGRISSLDGVRGLAVLSVLVFHTLPIPDPNPSTAIILWNSIVRSCWVGVDLFFVLSGFLITRVLFEIKTEPNYFRNFYARRALRIAPLYFTVLIGTFFVLPAIIPVAHLPVLFPRLIENQFWAWTFLQNYLQARSPHLLPGLGHFWTLAIEEQFYLAWPLLLFCLSRRSLLVISIAVCTLEPFARFCCLSLGYSTWAIRQLTYLRLDSLLVGAALYLLVTAPTTSQLLDSSTKWFGTLTVASVAAISWILYENKYLPYESRLTDIVGYSAVAVLGAALIHACLHNHFGAGRLFSGALLRWFGRYSYGIYVFSVPAILCFELLIGSRNYVNNPFLLALSRLLCAGLASTALAVVSWHVVEAPFLRLKSQFLSPRLSLVLATSTTLGP